MPIRFFCHHKCFAIIILRYAICFWHNKVKHLVRAARIELTEIESDCLRTILKKGSDWRERDRAKAIELLASGHTIKEVVEQQGLCVEAVRIRRRKWLKLCLTSLPD